MASDASVPHVHFENHRQVSSLVESNETLLSDHLPQGFPLYSPVWTETGADCGDLMLKPRHSYLPAGQCIPAWLLMVRKGDVATRKLCVLNCHCWYLQVWQPAWIPNVMLHKHTPTEMYSCIYKYTLNPVQTYTHTKEKAIRCQMWAKNPLAYSMCMTCVVPVIMINGKTVTATAMAECLHIIMFQSIKLCHTGGRFVRQHMHTSHITYTEHVGQPSWYKEFYVALQTLWASHPWRYFSFDRKYQMGSQWFVGLNNCK